MVLYIILEGVLVNTISGQDIPRGISDMKLNTEVFNWIIQGDWSNIIILSNQTWLYGAPGVRVCERFRSKIEYVSECLREALEGCGKFPEIIYRYSMKKPWCSGISDDDILTDDIWKKNPWLIGQPSTFVCRPIPFDIDYAKAHGLTNIISK